MLNGDQKGTAVRTPNGKIITRKEKIKLPKSRFSKLPFVRGVVKLGKMMVIGIKELNYSTNIQLKEGEEKEELSTSMIVISLILSFGLAIFLFKFAPLLITTFLTNKIVFLQMNNFLPNLLDGIIKTSIFVSYIYLISLAKDVRTVFEYHGSEHKTINCLERKLPLTVKNVKKCSRFHRRCGTSFVFGVFLISVFVYSLIPFNTTSFFVNFGLRILLLPVIAGISFEVLRLSGKNENNLFFKVVTAPGLWLQRLTTREPSEKQIEVAIKALKQVI